jgi:hypothetical protein
MNRDKLAFPKTGAQKNGPLIRSIYVEVTKVGNRGATLDLFHQIDKHTGIRNLAGKQRLRRTETFVHDLDG